MLPYEFTADDADIILRASRCDVPREFRVHKTILSIASPVFKDMFNIPQPISPTTRPAETTMPVIDVDDTPEDLEVFLRIIYPFGLPPMPTPDAVSDALVMLDKYQAHGGSLQLLRPLLVSPEFLKNDPIQVYSIACYWKFKEEADLAAFHTSGLDVLSHVREKDVQRLTSMEYHRILILGQERRSKSVGYIFSAPTACAGCPNHKRFYVVFRERLRVAFCGDRSVFYDYGGCIVRCFEIAVEVEKNEATLGCGIGEDSHLGRFIRVLAEKLSSPF